MQKLFNVNLNRHAFFLYTFLPMQVRKTLMDDISWMPYSKRNGSQIDTQKAVDDLDFLRGFISDQRACSRVSGVHGPASIWEKARPDHHAQKTRYSGSSQKTHQGTCRFFTNLVLTPLEEKLCLSFRLELQLFIRCNFVLCSKKENYGYLSPTPSTLPNQMQRTVKEPLHLGSCVWRDDFLKT